MNRAYLILGSNKGNTLANLEQAKQLIEKNIGPIIKSSDIYVTAAWGNTSQPDFKNQALCIDTLLEPEALLSGLLSIEKEMGRIRDHQKWMERIIDIDILFYNDIIIDTPDLKIPHPYLQDRKFVLIPLLQVTGSLFLHPVFSKSIQTLLEECTDALEVKNVKA
ncbi:MAG: 2-amino-4-hydroxy-6-hydroxymethyldihydropteridine diphosphokinase [Bacteroidetes bacterium]|nr:2-amino-4-hydroxy-6-hydroxymethyldihydropteridine diphosphokinase [Bacteroidota bacterium]